MGTLLACACLGGCAHGPVLAESQLRLQRDIRAVLQSSAERLSPPGTEPHVAPATTATCPTGGARTRLVGELPLRPGVDPRLLLDRAGQLALSLLHDRGYALDGPPGGGPRRREFTMSRDMPVVEFTVRLTGTPRPVLALDGITPCLPR